ncbi:MAG: UDP-N-acetylmuramoyl-tripeptide--D-alanyl-D-alanine ligase [Calditrichaeota bacterium]|nr:MAG: UDP-N-acetylmuramoyl-tripeptide--D-alanyl-D-alanine ligase [Calditrichota bacterium]
MEHMTANVLNHAKQNSTPDLNAFLTDFEGVQLVKGELPPSSYPHLSIDSRTLRQGQPFLALRGERFDGHDFVLQAWERGAGFVVVEAAWYFRQPPELTNRLSRIVVVADTLGFLQRLAAWHRRHFSLPVVGITGSAGKTTTREMLAAILSRRYRVLQNAGNQNNHIGVPLTLLKLRADHEVAVLEIGTNHPGEIALLTELIQPGYAIVTQIGKGHIGFFGSLDAVFEEKTALLRGLPAEGVAVLNGEDPFLAGFNDERLRILRAGFDQRFEGWGELTGQDALGRCTFRWRKNGQVTLAVPGRHHVLNALLAATMADVLGMRDADICAGLAAFQPVDKRMVLEPVGDVVFINDAYNANPDSMRAALSYLTGLSVTGRFAVLGDMLELGKFAPAEHRALLEEVSRLPLNGVALYGPEMHRASRALKQAPFPWLAGKDHQAIAHWLRERVRPGDVVLLKGSRGMRMEQVLEHFKTLQATNQSTESDEHAG